MKKRQITIILAIIVLLGSYGLYRFLIAQKSAPPKAGAEKGVRSVPVSEVRNSSRKTKIQLSGRLVARDRIEIYAEVSGKLLQSDKPFREGISFSGGAVLINIDDAEARLNLKAQKSALLNQLTAMMPDIKLDYAESFPTWEKYLAGFDINKPLPEFPEPANDQEKYFLASRNIYNQYYTIKSQEERLDKFRITAPFPGVVVESNIDPGSLVRVGQKLGEYIRPGSFEMEAALGVKDVELVNVGDTAELKSTLTAGKWNGEVIRLNKRIDPQTQSVKIFLKVEDPDLREGMYLTGFIAGKEVEDVFALPRKAITNELTVWVVNDSLLNSKPVLPVNYFGDSALVKGLENGELVVEKPLAGIFEGMTVKPYKE